MLFILFNIGLVIWQKCVKHIIRWIHICAALRLRGLIYHMRVFFYESAEKVLSYARLNSAVFNYFYMSLGQVKHTIVVSRYQNHEKDFLFILFMIVF